MNTSRIEQNGFRLIELVDDTSKTVVWKAVQQTLDRTVILRILKPEAAANPNEVDHFLTVARLIARVKSESVAAIFDIVSDGSLHYIVTEHVEGPTLEELVATQGPLPVDQALRIASSLIASLDQLWNSARIVLRNLKSSTVRLDPRGVAKITDFSLAITAGAGVDATAMDGGHIVGTPCFLSPEQAQGAHLLTTQSDMYTLGVILYHLSTGKVPFEDLDVVSILAGHIKQQVPPPHRINRHVPVSFSWFLHRLMMKNPNNRYADWDTVLHDIRLMLAGEEPSCVRPDEEYLSTISTDFDAPREQAAPEADTPRVRLHRKATNRSIAAYQDKHLVDAHAHEIRKTDRTRAVVCWGVLFVWLALVFWFRAFYQLDPDNADTAQSLSRFKNAVSLHVTDSLDELKALIERSAPEEPLPETPDDPPSAGSKPDPAPARPAAVPAAETPPPAAPATVAQKSEPSAEPPVPSGIPENLRASLIRALSLGDLAAARKAVQDCGELFQEKNALQKLLDETPDPDTLVADYLATQIGRPLLFEYNGKPRTVIPHGVENGIIHLESNGRGADIAISSLSADNKLQWMDRPKTPARCLAYCLTLMRSSRRAETLAQAAGCPLLADIIVRAADAALTAKPAAQ